MTSENKAPSPKDLSDKDKADIYLSLAEGARRRFENHHNVEWKIHFGLWTFFGGGAVLAATSSWKPTCLASVVITAVCVSIVLLYYFRWLPHSHNYREECTRSGWWWESYARRLLPEDDGDFPDHLSPQAEKEGKWRERDDKDWNTKLKQREIWGTRHESQDMCGAVAFAFMILFLCMVWDKCWQGRQDAENPRSSATQLDTVLESPGTKGRVIVDSNGSHESERESREDVE